MSRWLVTITLIIDAAIAMTVCGPYAHCFYWGAPSFWAVYIMVLVDVTIIEMSA